MAEPDEPRDATFPGNEGEPRRADPAREDAAEAPTEPPATAQEISLEAVAAGTGAKVGQVAGEPGASETPEAPAPTDTVAPTDAPEPSGPTDTGTPTEAPAAPAPPDTAATPDSPARKRRRLGLRATVAVGVVTAASGLLFGLSAINSNGHHTRGEVDLVSLVREREGSVGDLEAETRDLASKVSATLKQVAGQTPEETSGSVDLATQAVTGPGLTVTMTDAPPSTDPEIDPDSLVIHQQDVEDVMNALWSGGAEALTVQGVRVTNGTVVRCIGNVILVDGKSYSPPYVISAIGDPTRLQAGLDSSKSVSTILDYVAVYGLGWKVETSDTLQMPAVSQQTPLTLTEVGDSNE